MIKAIEDYLHQQGWVYAGVSQPDHRHQWAKIETDKDGKFKRIIKLEDEDYLVELAANIID